MPNLSVIKAYELPRHLPKKSSLLEAHNVFANPSTSSTTSLEIAKRLTFVPATLFLPDTGGGVKRKIVWIHLSFIYELLNTFSSPELSHIVTEGMRETTLLPSSQLVKELKATIRARENILNKKLGDRNLSILHILAIRGHLKAIRILLPFVDPNQQDKMGFTALHHSALANKREVEALLLSDERTDPSILNFRNGTAAHLRRNCYPDLPEPNEDGVTLWKYPVYDPEILAEDWSTPFYTPLTIFDVTFRDRLKEFYSSEARDFEICHIEADDEGKAIDKDHVGKVARNITEIVAGEIVAPYTGRIEKENLTSNVYKAKTLPFCSRVNYCCDAASLGWYSRYFADGIGLLSFPISSFQGMPHISILVAPKRYPAGSLMSFNYRENHSSKERGHIELAPNLLKSLLRSHTPVALKEWHVDFRARARLISNSDLSVSQSMGAICYLFSTPSSLLELLASKDLSSKKVMEYIDLFSEQFPGVSGLFASSIYAFIEVLQRNFSSIEMQATVWKSISDKSKLNPHRLIKMALFIYLANVMESTKELPRELALKIIIKSLKPPLRFSSPIGILTVGSL